MGGATHGPVCVEGGGGGAGYRGSVSVSLSMCHWEIRPFTAFVHLTP